ncbi:hypothetical protein NUW54_g14498 [Trametes sanguinea]|uniref:Uncharacterized protein n=1 Tax=Trametes sanguinea TaxID=158606 RepID=A0ACC1MDS5_9APHY|nr:hypothetical protein NUW54_g14498 [Trametes sanguinea]
MLLDALKRYERAARARESLADEKERLPKILMAVTGKGPLRQRYMREVEQLQMGNGQGDEDGWRYVRCASLWLEADDYPLLLGSADLGISLHSSSSGRDLPMKVVDMFGLARHPNECSETTFDFAPASDSTLVKDGVNGLVFHNAEQLAAQLESLLRGFPSAPALAALQASFQRAAHAPAGSPDHWEWGTWAENWNRTMRPLLLHDVASEAAL